MDNNNYEEGKSFDDYIDALDESSDLIDKGAADDNTFRKFFSTLLKVIDVHINHMDWDNLKVANDYTSMGYDYLNKWNCDENNEPDYYRAELSMKEAKIIYLAVADKKFLAMKLIKSRNDDINEELQDALDSAEGAYNLFESLYKTEGHDNAGIKMIESLILQSNIYEMFQSKYNGYKALEKIEQANMLCKHIVNSGNATQLDVQRMIADTYHKTALSILSVNEWSDLEEVEDNVINEMYIRWKIYNETKSAKDKKDLLSAINLKLLVLIGKREEETYSEIEYLLNQSRDITDDLKEYSIQNSTNVDWNYNDTVFEAECLWLEGVYESMVGQLTGLKKMLRAKKLSKLFVASRSSVVKKAWKIYKKKKKKGNDDNDEDKVTIIYDINDL